ncbi:MAG TPA: tryptophan synthase subunit alpha [Myxococcota bacterium]|nr:tryptophan synthase subunit alpha [Myxococcota bacterium]
MNRLDALFAERRPLLIGYLCAGDPSPAVSPELFQALVDGGADILEIGVPFSDPGADGPAIQRASERALAAGMTLEGALDIAADLDCAKVLFGYLNPFLCYGYERLAQRCAEVGIDGVLCVDCPVEEESGFRSALQARGIHPILLVAPTTPDDRIVGLAASAGGFLYYVSMTGVTGAAFQGDDDLVRRVHRVRELSGHPVAVGFGIRTAEDAALVARGADGVVVGSAFVRLVEAHGAEAVEPLRALTRELAGALENPSA